MDMSATVRDVMSTQVVVVTRDATFKDMAARLRQHRVSAFPVVDEDRKVIGVVSEADLLTKEALVTGEHLRPGPGAGVLHRKATAKAAALTAGDLMTAPPVTIGPDELVTSAAKLMYTCKVKRLPVIDADGRLVGIVSRADVLTVYARPDQEIKHEITEKVILNRFLVDPGRFTVTVKNGVVTFEGQPETAESGHGIVAEAWHVEGVVAVRDRLRYPPR
jgi:CBS-domain-containing membrane protein